MFCSNDTEVAITETNFLHLKNYLKRRLGFSEARLKLDASYQHGYWTPPAGEAGVIAIDNPFFASRVAASRLSKAQEFYFRLPLDILSSPQAILWPPHTALTLSLQRAPAGVLIKSAQLVPYTLELSQVTLVCQRYVVDKDITRRLYEYVVWNTTHPPPPRFTRQFRSCSDWDRFGKLQFRYRKMQVKTHTFVTIHQCLTHTHVLCTDQWPYGVASRLHPIRFCGVPGPSTNGSVCLHLAVYIAAQSPFGFDAQIYACTMLTIQLSIRLQ